MHETQDDHQNKVRTEAMTKRTNLRTIITAIVTSMETKLMGLPVDKQQDQRIQTDQGNLKLSKARGGCCAFSQESLVISSEEC
jgi:hypothetical protein